MLKVMALGAAMAIVLSALALGQGLYPVYYDCTAYPGGSENATRVYVSNPNDTAVQYTVKVYNANGVKLGSADYIINSHTSHHIWLPDLIAGDRAYAWGMCVVQTWLGYPTDLEVVAERYLNGALQGYDAIPTDAVGGRHTFFYNAAQSPGGPNNDTHVSVMNPTDTANHYQIELFDMYGNTVAVDWGVVNPNTTNVHRLADLVSGNRGFAQGLCVIRAQTYAYEMFAVNVYRMRDGLFLNAETVPRSE